MLVGSAVTFAEILEAELHCTNDPRASGNGWNRPLTTPLFIFDRLDPPRGHFAVHAEAPTKERATPLSAIEQRALLALNDLGADLDQPLSFKALRRAFRRLARRYHPDRHPGSGSAEQERLARVFVEVTEHYRVLAAAIQEVGRATAC